MKDHCIDCTVKGKCCTLGILKNGKKHYLVDPIIYCPHLDQVTNRCTVYKNRPDWCTDLSEYAEIDGVPAECGYRDEYDFKYEEDV